MRVVLCRCVPRQLGKIKLRKEIKLIKKAASSAEAIMGLIILINLIRFTSAMAWVTRNGGFSRSGQTIRIRDAVSSLNPAANNFSGLAEAKKYFLLFDNRGVFEGIGVFKAF